MQIFSRKPEGPKQSWIGKLINEENLKKFSGKSKGKYKGISNKNLLKIQKILQYTENCTKNSFKKAHPKS